MATQSTSLSSQQATFTPKTAAKRPPKIDTHHLTDGSSLLSPPEKDTVSLSPTTEQLPPAPPSTPVQPSPKAKVQFGSAERSGKKERSFIGAVGDTVGGVARAAIQGTAYLLGSNLLTVPAAGLLALTGVGILPALGVLFLGPLVAGAYGAVRGYQGKFI